MYYSLEPSWYFLFSIFPVWSKYVKYPQLYEGRNERTYTRTKHITTILIQIQVKNQNYFTDYIHLWINLFVTFMGRFLVYPVFNIFAQNV